MTRTQVIRTGNVLIPLLLGLTILLGASLNFAQASQLPFDHPASGTEILCYLNGVEDVDGVSVVRPPFPTFNVGTCENNVPPPPAPACSNGSDDDGDGFTDTSDPNCHTDGNPSNTSSYDPNKDSESGSLPACWNKADDDGDGKTDFPNDPGCSSATDNDEADGGTSVPPVLPQCSNGTDDDGDGKVDSADSGCHMDFNASNTASYDPNGTSEAATVPQCSDLLDNDGDGLTDMADQGCSSASDNDETDATSGGGGGGGGGGNKSPTSTTTGIVLGFSTTTESCDRYLTAFIREGQENDKDQVRRLQRFLRDFEGAKVVENGVYDAPTLAAVHAFQTKYAADILTPWGATESTGYVYLTTRKKVNEIFCRFTKTFFLTVEEEQKIKAVREATVGVTPVTPRAPTPPAKPVNPPVVVSGSTTQNNSAVNNVLNFFKGLLDSVR